MIVQTQVPDSTRIESEIANGSVTLKFPGHGNVKVVLADCHSAVQDYSMLYGMMVRLTRATAVSRSDGTKVKSAKEMLLEKFEAAKALADHYNSGNESWETRARAEKPDSLLAQALAEWSKKPLDHVQAKLAAMSKADRTKLASHAEIAPIYARLLAEQSTVSADDLLASI